jgi:hypothetical protein
MPKGQRKAAGDAVTGDVATMARLVPIVVLKLPHIDDCVVVPPIAEAIKANADLVRWSNHTGDTITVYLPGGVDGSVRDTFSIPDLGHQDRSVAGGTPGTYFYQVKCNLTSKFAKGNSDPTIIID